MENDLAYLLKRDVKNAFNEVVPDEFLLDACEYAPISSTFAECCYANPVKLTYYGRIIESSRGQQGYPAMGDLFCLVRKRMAEEARQNQIEIPEYEPEFADDSFSGGHHEAVWTIFK